ncbi:MAG: cytochrome P460 family protein [Acidiferrobacterales bacterium]
MKRSLLLVLSITIVCFSSASAQYGASGPVFGGSGDVNFAKSLWKTLTKRKLVGVGAIGSTPYKGTHPHGVILETLETTVSVSGKKGIAIIKKNYGGANVSKAAVANDPKKYLKAVTVMFKRESNYDADNKDWFWVKYGPDGQVLKNPTGKLLAGRVAKGAGKGCIACHKTAPGGDYVFNHDRHAG